VSGELVRRIEACRRFPATVEVPLEGDILGWLQRQADDFKLIWRARGASQPIVGLGVARRVTGVAGEPPGAIVARCRTAIAGLPDARIYGGFAFAPDSISGHSAWSAFGFASFWLPRATWQGNRLAVTVLDADDVAAAVRFAVRLSDIEPRERPVSLPSWSRRVDRPDRNQWDRNIEATMRMFADEVLEKIVLARQVELEFDAPLSPVALLRRLAPVTPGCYHFCLQTSHSLGFVGATPERLFWRRGNELASEVLAGTRPRGRDAGEDQLLADELLASTKDHLEHDIVRKSIRQRLHGYVERLEVDGRVSLLKLATKQHLFSRVTAQLRAGVDDGALIERLHPTPAVGGYPTENALDEIRLLEPFERGWYAAPVGWIGHHESEFAVAIRSGMVHDNRLLLYSGAGVVPASTAEAEWSEIENKISDFLQLLVRAGSGADTPSG
jgi:menaquinone-specific isochorismate synthase